MRPTEIWSTGSRIIEVGATDGAIGERLVAAGIQKIRDGSPVQQAPAANKGGGA